MRRVERLAWKALLIAAAVTAGVALKSFIETWLPGLRPQAGMAPGVVIVAAWSLWLSASPYQRDLLIWRLGWTARWVKPAFARLLAPLAWRGMTAGRAPTPLRGFRVYLMTFGAPEWDVGALLARLGEELDLLRRLAPSRFERLRRIDPDLMLMPAGAGGYSGWANGLTLDPALLTAWAPGYAATMLVHESNHARLHELKIPVGHPWVIDRAEQRALKDQWLFARRLLEAGYEEAVGQFLALAEEARANPWWTGAGKRELRREQLERMGMPTWVRWLFGVRRRRTPAQGSPTPADG